MAYVQKDADGKVTATYGGPQPGVTGCVDIADNDPGLLAFIAAQNPAKPQSVTGSQFINRFTPTEQGALATAAQGNPQMLVMMISMAAAGSISLTDPQVVAGVMGLVNSGMLTQTRALTILDH
jgi:hypothetical protein